MPRLHRLVATAIALAALCSCAEVVNGPRVVAYTESRVVIRHAPVFTSNARPDWLAAEFCGIERIPKIEWEAQYSPFDVRDVLYQCEAYHVLPIDNTL